MGSLLDAFGRMFVSAAWLAAPAALAWGALSIFLSPCHLSSIPLVIAYMSGGEGLPGPKRAAALSGAFAVGSLVSIGAVGAVTVAAGRIAGDVGRAGAYALAAVFFVFGLNLLGVLPLPPWSMPSSSKRRGPAGALLLGTAFGAALGPCTFAFMAPLLGLAFRAGSNDARFGGLLVALYGLGHVSAIVLAGVSVEGVQRRLSSRGAARAAGMFRLGAGAVVLAGGLYFLLTAV